MCLIFAAFSGNRAVHLYAGYRRAWLWSGEEIMTNDRRLQGDQDQQQHPDALAKVQNTELLRSVPGSGAHAARLQVKRGSSQRSGPPAAQLSGFIWRGGQLMISMSWEEERALNQACVETGTPLPLVKLLWGGTWTEDPSRSEMTLNN